MKIFNSILGLFLALFLFGCVGASNVVLNKVEDLGNTAKLDIEAGIKLGQPVLGDQDNLVVCYSAIDKVLSAYNIAETKDPNGKLFYDIMRLRIIQQVTQQNSQLLQKQCAAIAQEVMMAVVTRGRSLQPNININPVPTPAPVPVPAQ